MPVQPEFFDNSFLPLFETPFVFNQSPSDLYLDAFLSCQTPPHQQDLTVSPAFFQQVPTSSPEPTSSCSPSPTLSSGPSTPHAIKKRPHKRLLPHQRNFLLQVYAENQMPNTPLMRQVAEKVGMSFRHCQYWFQNKRAAERKAAKCI
ncbi:hypothetical protein HDU98_003457 [Podochytrium sp. JEL0797]|nr:hypothetical protein HDU98_003457 [Podochytrium sp. JEL0797]